MMFNTLDTHRDPITGLNVIAVDDIEAAESRSRRAESPAASPPKPAPTPAPVSRREPAMPTKSNADVVRAWNSLVKSHEATGMTKAEATRKAAVENPDLHAGYLAAYKALSSAERRRLR